MDIRIELAAGKLEQLVCGIYSCDAAETELKQIDPPSCPTLFGVAYNFQNFLIMVHFLLFSLGFYIGIF